MILRFAVRGAPVPRCWAEHPQEKMVHLEKLEGNLRKTNMFKQKAKFPMSHQPLLFPGLNLRQVSGHASGHGAAL